MSVSVAEHWLEERCASVSPSDVATGVRLDQGRTRRPGQRGGYPLRLVLTRTSRRDEQPRDPSVVALGTVTRRRSELDASMIEATAAVVVAVRDRVLARKGLLGAELGRGQAREVASEVRRLAAAEAEVLAGFGVDEARQLVGVATARPVLRQVVTEALRRGEASWSLVRVFWQRSARLTDDQQLLVAEALFGTDAAEAAEERLDEDGDLSGEPWAHATFAAACRREVTACEGQDVVADRERRRRAYAARRASVRAHDDGTATLTVTGPAITVSAVHQRIDRISRTVRRGGDERTLDQLRCDVIETLLLHGVLDLPQPDQLDLITPQQADRLAAVLDAQPSVQLQVVVPADALAMGFPVCGSCAAQLDAEADDPRAEVPPVPGPPPGPPAGPPAGPPPGPLAGPPPADGPPGRGLVGEVLGPLPFFVTPGHGRELALLPGTTLTRLLTDPADGRLIERTIKVYRPDAQMRRQVMATDLYSRAPGSRLSGQCCELDHVTPYGAAGGQTCETNLASLDKRRHQFKTLGAWHVAIRARRDLTFTTVLGQVVGTRSHDYRQYLHVREPEDLEDRLDLANRAVYAALAARPEHRVRPRAGAWLTLTHTTRDGSVRPGPPAGATPLDVLLGIVGEHR